VSDERYLVERKGIEPGIQVTGMFVELVRKIGCTRSSRPDEVGREETPPLTDPRQHPPQQIRRSAVAVKEHERGPGAHLLAIRLRAEHIDRWH